MIPPKSFVFTLVFLLSIFWLSPIQAAEQPLSKEAVESAVTAKVNTSNAQTKLHSVKTRLPVVHEAEGAVYKFTESGELAHFAIRSQHYSKAFVVKDMKPLDEDEVQNLNDRSGVRFGFLDSGFKTFEPVEHKYDKEKQFASFRLKDNDPKSKSYGLEILKTYKFLDKPYQFELDIELYNPTDRTLALYTNIDVNKNLGLMVGVTGQADYFSEYFIGEKGALEAVDMETQLREISPQASYLGVRNSYFVLGFYQRSFQRVFAQQIFLEVPKGDTDDSKALSTAFLPLSKDAIQAGERAQFNVRFYFGEKRAETMEETLFATCFNKYGEILGGIERFMFLILTYFYQLTQSYGWSILLLTLLVKLILLPMSLKQVRSMAKMQELQPKMQELQKKYGEDKQRLNMEMMNLYKTHQVNPVAGCLPMILQIPIFFALFYTVGSSVEMYGAAWLWIENLAKPDPTRLLPFIFVATFMFSQRKMMKDPNQRMMVMILPIVFFFMMQSLSSGVMIYIVGQNIFTILEQMISGSKTTQEEAPEVEVEKPSKQKSSNSSKNKNKKRKKAAESR